MIQYDTQSEVSEVDVTRDGDDVYYQFAGAALCDMRCKQIKTCPADRKDIVSQGFTGSEYKGKIHYTHHYFIPFFQKVDHVVKSIAIFDGFSKYGDDFIKVLTSICMYNNNKVIFIDRNVLSHSDLIHEFKRILSLRTTQVVDEAAVENV